MTAFNSTFPARNYLFKVNNRNTRTRNEGYLPEISLGQFLNTLSNINLEIYCHYCHNHETFFY